MRLVDTMIFVYFDRVGLLEHLLALPELAVTSSVVREVRRWQRAGARVGEAIANGDLALLDVDLGSETEPMLYFLYRDRDGFGDGEAASMAVAHGRGFSFVSHDLEAAHKMLSLGIRVLDWPDMLAELEASGRISQTARQSALRRISGMMKGR